MAVFFCVGHVAAVGQLCRENYAYTPRSLVGLLPGAPAEQPYSNSPA